MKHKHGAVHQRGNPHHQTADSPAKPSHPKSVAESESIREVNGPNDASKFQPKPSRWWRTSDWVTAISTFILAVFAFGSFILLWKQLNDARNAFIGDQRPYIWLSQNDMPLVKLGEKAAWNFHYTDFGKSPAVGVAVRCQVRLYAHNTPEMKDMFAPIHKKGYEYEGLVIPPNDRSNWSTCFSEEDITNDDLKTMSTYDGAAKLMLFFKYFHTGWNKYTSQICVLTRRPNAGSPVMPCPAENKIQ